jgi:glycosyltransferase involved in cell wall biosynthesis
MQQSAKKNILHLPRWYPNPSDPQNGVFVEKQIKSVDNWFNNLVLFVKSEDITERYKVKKVVVNNTTTLNIYFKKSNNTLINLYRYLNGFKKGLKIIIKENGKPDLIHVHILLRTGILGWWYSKKFNIPYIVTEHWSGYITGAFEKKNFIYKKLSLFVLKSTSKIIVVSPSLKTELIQRGISEEKIEIIPNVVESLKNNNSTKINNDKTIILSVADLVDDIKRISDVIDVISKLDNKENIEYHIIGDGIDRERLETTAKRKGVLNSVVFFLGRKTNEEVLEIINSCDFLVTNSTIETFSVVTAEALLAGKPVIATRCGGPEYFVNKSNGILIKSRNRNELADAIKIMISTYSNYDPERLKQGVTDKFNSYKIGMQLKKVYDKVLQSK